MITSKTSLEELGAIVCQALKKVNDKQGLEQAVMVAQSQPFKRSGIKRFCAREGNIKAYKEFIEKLGK